MSKTNQIFNDTYFSTRILVDSTRLRDTLEKNRDAEISATDDEETKQEILNKYKRKLQSIYRIRNNAYSFLLKNGFQCTCKIDETDGSKIFYMDIEGATYDCKESAIKNILGKEYEDVVKYCLTEEEYSKILEEEKQVGKTESKVEKVPNTNTPKVSSVSQETTDQVLDSFMEINSMMEEAGLNVDISLDSDNKENTEIKESPKIITKKDTVQKTNRCPRCFAPLDDNQTVCDFCGYDMQVKNVLSREELKEIDDSEEFNEEDIDRMFEELEKRLNAQNNSVPEVKTVEISETPTISSYINQDDFETVRLYNPEKSEPFKHRSELIMDIYTLKLKDPKIIDNDAKLEKEKEEHRRKRKSEYEAELNASNQPEPQDDNETIREVKIFVYPLSVPETGNELSSEILVYITQDGNYGSFCSGTEGINTVKVNTNIHNFLVRGTWENGEFSTKIFPNGKTLEDSCEVERTKEEIRPNDIVAAKLGHPITFLSVEYVDGTETMKIHAVPISSENDLDGFAKTLYLMENVNRKERKLFITKSTNYITFEFEDEIYKATAKWDDDIYKMKVENY